MTSLLEEHLGIFCEFYNPIVINIGFGTYIYPFPKSALTQNLLIFINKI